MSSTLPFLLQQDMEDTDDDEFALLLISTLVYGVAMQETAKHQRRNPSRLYLKYSASAHAQPSL